MKRSRERGTQTNVVIKKFKDQSTQIGGTSTGSYARNEFIKSNVDKVTHRYLLSKIISNKEQAISWCMENNLLAKSMQCPTCQSDMLLKFSNTFSSDGCKWRCQKGNHTKDVSIRKKSWFEKSNMTIEEILELTYWWSTG